MHILYGVVGEGMGHATRSSVVLEHLLAAGHTLRIVVSGRAHALMSQRFGRRPGVTLHEISGLEMAFDGTELDKSRTVWRNLERLPTGLLRNIDVYAEVAGAARPDVVISDFESWAYLYGLNHRVPVVSIDNMQVLNRCRHDADVTRGRSAAFRLAKYFVKAKLPLASHYLVTSFFFPPVRKPRTTLVPPILRPEILAARREPGEHVLVYLKASQRDELLPVLAACRERFRVYGAGDDARSPADHVQLRPFSEAGFVDDLRRARALVAPGGYSLMGEAVHLGVPMLAVPMRGQYEQELNARYLDKLGYGRHAEAVDAESLGGFLGALDRHAAALRTYTPRDNSMLFGALDEVLRRITAGDENPERLDAPSLGSWSGDTGPGPDDEDSEDDGLA